MPVPLSSMVCCEVVEPGKVAASVNTSEPVILPTVVGTKLMDSSQEEPAFRSPADAELAVTSGHAEGLVVFRLKLDEILGLLPLAGIGKISGEFPLFSKVTFCGLSVLVDR